MTATSQHKPTGPFQAPRFTTDENLQSCNGKLAELR